MPRSRPCTFLPGAGRAYLFTPGLDPGCKRRLALLCRRLCCGKRLLSSQNPAALLPLWGGWNDSIGIGGFGHLQPEQRCDIAFVEYLRRTGRCSCSCNILPGTGEQFIFIHTAQHEEKLRLFVESGANAIERRRDVFAHVCPVRTTTRQLDFLGRRKQTVALPT